MNNLDEYVNHCRLYIGEKPFATDDEIDVAVGLFSRIFPTVDKNEVKKKLLTLYSLPIKPYKALIDSNNPGAGWLTKNNSERKKQISWRFWNRYDAYLREVENFSPGAIYELNRSSDSILNNLFDPKLSEFKFSKKGLVVGQVQSGKTSNFTALICKAVDAGFNVIIVFAGILDDLRTQTQSRLEKSFLGFTTRDIEKINNKEIIGVGKINPEPIAHSFTTVLSDFKETTINSLGVNFQTKEPVLFVVKKNGRILENLKKWLEVKDCEGKSALFIDDEADNASINTSKDLKKASSINNKIRDILCQFTRSAYVGYTATPYANIFVDRYNENDLFPRHFIINLETPPAYLSPERVFGIDTEFEQPLPIVNVVRDYQKFVPDKHKKNDFNSLTYQNLPESLKYAIRCFILACAVRCARGQKNKHNSMLIHLSRFQIWQNKIKEIIQRCFKYYRQEIMSDDASIYDLFRETYECDFCQNYEGQTMSFKSFNTVTDEIILSDYKILKQGVSKLSWNEVESFLYYVVDKIEVKSLNGASSDVLTYDEHEDDGYYVIAIGGDKLSRGLTLEGLTISYFLRASKMYDTLMQMGRWFGFRPGYIDVCRLFVSDEINSWFKNITIANHELREDFDYLWQTHRSPQEFALKVRTSPGLLVTSPLKMQSIKDVQLSWASTLVETYSLIRNHETKKYNYGLTSDFLLKLGNDYIKSDKESCKGYLWQNVPYRAVCEYISMFKLPETTRLKMNFEKMVDYIEKSATTFAELQYWRVLVKNVNGKSKSEFHFGKNQEISGICTDRTIVNNTQSPEIYNLKNYRLISGPEDEFLDIEILGEKDLYYYTALEETKALKAQLHKENPQIKEWTKNYPSPTLVRKKYRPTNCPVMIIYPLNPSKANFSNNQINIESFDINEDPFIGFAIIFPHSSNEQGIKYKVNEIKELSETEVLFENENDNTYPE